MKEAGKSPSGGPGSARSEPSHLKRFYSEVATKDEGVGVGVLLDGKPVRTPGKAPFVVPNKALAEANRARFTITSKINDGTLVEVAFVAARVPAK